MSFPADEPEPGDDNYIPHSRPEHSRSEKIAKGLFALLITFGIGIAVISSCVDNYRGKRPKDEGKAEYKTSSGLENNVYSPEKK